MYNNTWESHDGYVFDDELSYLRYTANWEDYAYGPIGMGARRKDESKDTSYADSYEQSYSRREDTYSIKEVCIIHETEKAFLFRDSNGDFWLPKKKIGIIKTHENMHTIKVPDWCTIKYLTNQKGEL